MKIRATRIAAVLLGAIAAPPAALPQSMTVSSFDGPVTASEISSFKTYVHSIQPVVWPNTGSIVNEYAQGGSGEALKAMGLMYEITGDTAILDRMIYFCDVLLEERNDLLAAPYGRQTMWTGTIAADWLGGQNNPAADGFAASGDPVGHLAYCARLILATPSILNQPVSTGDVYGHGPTYGARAATFLAEGDYTIGQYMLPYALNLGGHNNQYYFAANSPYKGGDPLPWNQQMMVTHGLQNLAAAHAILGDNPSLVAQYDGIVQTNINWYFAGSPVMQSYTDAAGNTAYNWAYDPSGDSGEDSNHGSLDCAGFYRAYLVERYGITSAMMAPFANMFCDVMTQGLASYNGQVNGGSSETGHPSATDYARSGYLFLADFRPDQYYGMEEGAFLTPGGNTTSTDTFSRFLWVKNRRYEGGYVIGFSPVPGVYTSSQSVALTSLVSGASIRYTTDGSAPTETHGTLYSGSFNVGTTTTVKAISYLSGYPDSPVTTGVYSFAASKPSFSPASGSYATGQTVTISTSTGGASIKYTTDGTIPSSTNGTTYVGPLSVTADTKLTAVAFAGGLVNSPMAVGEYTIGPAASTPTISPGGGNYSSPQTVTLSSSTNGASIYYTIDGSTPYSNYFATNGNLYAGPVQIQGNVTLRAVAIASGGTNSSVASAAYTVASTVGTPAISPNGGTYSAGQQVSLSSSTAGSTILFTLDGSDPTTTTGMAYIYLKPFTLAANATVKAYAYATGMNSSAVSSAGFTINSLPSPWTDADIGSPPLAGSASYASGTFTQNGCGADIWGASDQFNYLYQPTSGDYTVTAEVASQTNTNLWAKAGLMARASTAANDVFVNVFVTPGHGVNMAYRTTAGGSCTNISGAAGAIAPYWVSLTRLGNTFTAYSSSNGTGWTQVGSVTLSLPADALVGTMVCSHTTSALSTAAFSGLSVTEPSPVQFSIPAASVTASGYHSGYPPSNTVDGIDTVANRWAQSGASWIQYDLGSVAQVASVNISWSYARQNTVSIAVSNDGVNWTVVLANQESSQQALTYQAFAFPDNVRARYVRFNCAGSSYDGYTNISQTQIFGY